MKDQEYLLKKFVRAKSATEALAKDKETPVHEVFLVSDKPDHGDLLPAVGFHVVKPEFE